MASAKPVGELKKIVSLIDRSDFDEYVYPPNADKTKFRPEIGPIHSNQPDWGGTRLAPRS